jgi:hypothetical protein
MFTKVSELGLFGDITKKELDLNRSCSIVRKVKTNRVRWAEL